MSKRGSIASELTRLAATPTIHDVLDRIGRRRGGTVGFATAAPDLVDVETVAVLRKRWRGGDLTVRRFRAAVDDLLAHVALAESLGYTLVTADARLSRSPGIQCRVEVLGI